MIKYLFLTAMMLYFSNKNLHAMTPQEVLLPEPQSITFPTAPDKPQTIRLLQIVKNPDCASEGYHIEINQNLIKISHSSSAGLFYAQQTLRQLQNYYGEKIPSMTINDFPKMKWRGLHLDVSRHFFSVDEIKKFIKTMAFFKFNRLHLHLTDGPGWRIEIKKYPKLTQIGAWRIDKTNQEWAWQNTELGTPQDQRKRYGGFYTQEEMKDLIKFAQKHHVMIVPEIEMPGHSFIAMMAYPELACEGNNIPIDGLRGKDMICVGKPETTTFFINVLQEIINLFPTETPIHIGGDEVMHNAWLSCPHCKARMQKENLSLSSELQTAFMRDIVNFLKKQNRQIIAWDEIFEDGLSDQNVTTMVWRDPKLGYQAAQKGPVILCPGEWCYFDMYQGNPQTEPKANGGNIPLNKVYSFYPLKKELPNSIQQNIIGIQANIWTEHITTMKHVEYMTWPRGLAIADIAWHGQPRDYTKFLKQVKEQLKFLEKNGCNFRPLNP